MFELHSMSVCCIKFVWEKLQAINTCIHVEMKLNYRWITWNEIIICTNAYQWPTVRFLVSCSTFLSTFRCAYNLVYPYIYYNCIDINVLRIKDTFHSGQYRTYSIKKNRIHNLLISKPGLIVEISWHVIFTPSALNVVFSSFANAPKSKERHCVFSSGWSRFFKIVRDRNNLILI